MLENNLKTVASTVLENGDASDILNSRDPFLIALYRISHYIYSLYMREGDITARLSYGDLITWIQNVPFTNIKIIVNTHNDLGVYYYIIMGNKIILIEYNCVFSNLEKIYNILKENL